MNKFQENGNLDDFFLVEFIGLDFCYKIFNITVKFIGDILRNSVSFSVIVKSRGNHFPEHK